jgi:lipoate-protein ligase A
MFNRLDLILPQESFDGPMQMALDEVLLKSSSSPLMRFYRWSEPCVSFGYFQKFTQVRALHPGLPLVRRWTGGGVVEHGRDLTFSLMIPRGESMAGIAPSLFYARLHHALGKVLENFYREKVTLAGDGDVRSGDSCFSAPAHDDLLWKGRKILGGAQRRSDGALLYQGSLQNMTSSLTGDQVSQLVFSLARAVGENISIMTIDAFQINESEALSQNRYGSDAWNQRR